MSKEAFYFSHDYNARNDPKLMRLSMRYGMDGLGLYWCIIEMLYEQNGKIPLINIESIAYELHSECERIKSVLRDFDLFKFQDDFFYSDSVLRRLDERNIKSNGARESALKRWYPELYKNDDANAMRTHSEGNARKGKERKGKERKEVFDFADSLIALGVEKNIVADWLQVRKAKKAANTETAFKSIEKEIALSGASANECIKIAVENSWQGFKAEWYKNKLGIQTEKKISFDRPIPEDLKRIMAER